MNSPNNLFPKLASLIAMGALLTANQLSAANTVAAGNQFGAAINVADGKLRTWGLNDVGQLGLGNNTSPQPLPTVVTGPSSSTAQYMGIDAGSDYMLGIRASGSVYAWGSNTDSKLGIGTTTNVNVPTLLNFNNGSSTAVKIVDVSAGFNFAFAIDDNGNLYGWGQNSGFQMGLGYNTDPFPTSEADTVIESPIPIVVPGALNTWLDVAASKIDAQFTVGIKTDGTLWVWGNGASIVGSPLSSGPITVPYKLGTATNWVEVEVGGTQVIARNSKNEIYTWGIGYALGQGNSLSKFNITKPTKISVQGVTSWSAIGVGLNTTYAIDSNGRLFGWGDNANYQLGPTNSYILYTPVEISPGYTFTAAVGGDSNFDPNPLVGFTLTQGIDAVGVSGFYTLGTNAKGQLGLGFISFGVSPFPQRAAADGLRISISNPTVDSNTENINVGVNTLHDITTTVTNSGDVAITTGYTVELFFTTEATLKSTAVPILSTTITSPLAKGVSNTVTFSDFPIGNINGGTYYIYSRVTLVGSSPGASGGENLGQTQITVEVPNIVLQSLQLDKDEITLPEPFIINSVQLKNDSKGVIPAGADFVIPITAYISDDPIFDSSDTPLTITPSLNYSNGLQAGETVDLGTASIAIPSTISSGVKYIFLIADEGQTLLDSDNTDNQISKQVSLFTPQRIDLAIDYGYYEFLGDNGKWTSQPDTLASGGLAYISPTLAQTQSASIKTTVIGPTTLNVPWRIEAAPADDVTITIDPKNGGAFSFNPNTVPPSSFEIAGYVPVYRTNEIILEDVDEYEVTWTYHQDSTFTGSFAFLDLDIPVFQTTGDGLWVGEIDPTAIVGDRSVRSPTLNRGLSASFEVEVVGPALVTFWVKTDSDPLDTVSFLVDGTIQSLPTRDFSDPTVPATFSGVNDWQKVAFLVEGGPRVLRWLYKKGSESLDSVVYIDALSISKPIPEQNDPHRDTLPVDPAYANIPQYNVDLAVQDVVATPGNYILDDSQGTGRLPITVVVGSVGSDFDVSSIKPNFVSNIQVRLSLDTVFGNADDVILGSYAETQIIKQGDKIVMSAEINLPFDTPAGNYNVLVRFIPPPIIQEFSYVNNTAVVGPGFIIIRAPDLVANNITTPSYSYPFHPEDTVTFQYNITNRGLGTITLTDTFDVSVRLQSLTRNSFDEVPTVIKVYDSFELSVFLPEVSATFPNGGTTTINQFITLPTLRDILVALGEIPAGTPEDAADVSQNQNAIKDKVFYFDITLDSTNAILESSETNLFASSGLDPETGNIGVAVFNIFPTPGIENYGSYTSQLPFADFLGVVGTDLSDSMFNTDGDALNNLLEYALATNPTLSTPIFQPGTMSDEVVGSYNVAMLTVPPSSVPQAYLTITFDFNVRANDITITLQAADGDMAFDEDILELTPPYIADYGPQSLTGFNGLKDNPLVLSVDGNVSATGGGGTGGIQKVYSARVTIRDTKPLEELVDGVDYTSRLLRLKVSSLVTDIGGKPENLNAAYNGENSSVQLSWTPSNALNPAEGGAFQILRSVGAINVFVPIASTTGTTYIDSTVSSLTGYTYKVRLVNAAGTSDESDPTTVVVP